MLYRSRPWPFILPWKSERFYGSRLLILAYPCSSGLGPVTLEELPVLEEARATTCVVQRSSGCDCFRQDYENIKSISSHRVACRSSSRRHTACEASSPPRQRCTKHQHREPSQSTTLPKGTQRVPSPFLVETLQSFSIKFQTAGSVSVASRIPFAHWPSYFWPFGNTCILHEIAFWSMYADTYDHRLATKTNKKGTCTP